MAKIFKFNESLTPEDDLLLLNLLNFYTKKFEIDGAEKFYIQACDMVEMGDIEQAALDEFCKRNELDKDSLEFNPKTGKMKKKKAVTKAKRTEVRTEYRDTYGADGCGAPTRRSSC